MTTASKPGSKETTGGAAASDETVKTVRQQQHTGNHEPETKKDSPGGTRTGAENVEPR